MVYCVKPLTVPFANVIGMVCASIDSADCCRLTLAEPFTELRIGVLRTVHEVWHDLCWASFAEPYSSTGL